MTEIDTESGATRARTQGRPSATMSVLIGVLLALAPLLLGLLPHTVPGTIAMLAEGIGTAGMAVGLIAIASSIPFRRVVAVRDVAIAAAGRS